MMKSKFISNLMKPFKFHSDKDVSKEENLEQIAAQEQKVFSFETLVAATRDFHPDNKLGQGGFGPVYRGKLGDGREIAVKKLSQSSNQGKKEFMNEAKLLARVQHRNVVNLLGYCTHGAEKILVYEYLPRESLDKFIFDAERKKELDWKRRFDIISGVARGLLYLHEDSPSPIIHRDIKASNILLDEKWVPKIADFGMARLFPEDQTHVNTRVAGTNGYMAPEYLMHGRLSAKADVFSFGVVVLELISGQKNSTFYLDIDCQNLLDWAYKLYKKNRSLEIMDPTLASTSAIEQIATCIHIGLLCTQADPVSRPNMRRVGVMLSKKPGTTLEEPTRPGYPGSRYRRTRRATVGSSSGSGAGSGSFGESSSHTHNTFASTFNSNSASATTASTSLTSPRPDTRGKRPIQG
ncbi:PREDICTED: putative receptor-like protein kinase At4g00960 [Nelumbo nucifera]|uniref:Receptor-like protein kinase At4g00960 n=1 Tax=Nelumbo nucifera TaxID=4432 RepID=A0A1U8B1Z0_NELNU|nr:PREDICTED: putative receptor-like protein kinase At4g00960 [Nelumbo nucifera]